MADPGFQVVPIPGMPMVGPGDDLAALIADAIAAQGIELVGSFDYLERDDIEAEMRRYLGQGFFSFTCCFRRADSGRGSRQCGHFSFELQSYNWKANALREVRRY